MSDGKEVQKWADDFMFEAEAIDPDRGAEVWLLSCNPDPLGSIAAAAMAYEGKFVTSLAEITDKERRRYLGEIQKTALAMPLEVVQLHFRVSGVTRGFTHQMVRQRTAAYSQESTRFAVKSGVPVGLPPSLNGSNPDAYNDLLIEAHNQGFQDAVGWAERYVTEKDKWRYEWDNAVGYVAEVYNRLIAAGMPAEDARGLLPTNLLTQINYITNLRNFQAEAGKRLCTQAQFEWREVWFKFVEAIREFGKTQVYLRPSDDGSAAEGTTDSHRVKSAWQFEELAKLFAPVCYYKGSCQFMADFDRKCTIRDRVEANAAINRPSSEWSTPMNSNASSPDEIRMLVDLGIPTMIPAIYPEEWFLNPGAAR